MRLGRVLRRFAVGLAVTLGVIVLVVVVGRITFRQIGSRKLAETTAKLDAEDPGWRIDDIEASRKKTAPPDAENSAVTALRLHREVPPGWDQFDLDGTTYSNYPTNEHPAFFHFVAILQARTKTAEARDLARRELLRPELLARRGGLYPLTINENPITTLLPHVQNARGLERLLEYDARIAALEGDPTRAHRSARAGLVIARSIGDEPFLISQLVRIACTRVAVQSALQTLAWGEAKDGLAELQAEFRAEADYPWLLTGLRGERGAMDQLFTAIESGKVNARDFAALGIKPPAVFEDVALGLYKGLLPGDRAKYLEVMTAYIEAAKKPPHELRAALAAVPLPPRPPEDFRYVVTSLITPAIAKFGETTLRTRADLLAASVALACERFRLAHGRWPETLGEIPKDILPEIPPDPYSGQPLLYRRVEDGVLVFSVGGDDQQKRMNRQQNKDPLADYGQGWKLWNPDRRGLPAVSGLDDTRREAVEPAPAPREVPQP